MGGKRCRANEGCEQKSRIGVVPIAIGTWYTAEMSEAWRGICSPGTILIELYECRGTMLLRG